MALKWRRSSPKVKTGCKTCKYVTKHQFRCRITNSVLLNEQLTLHRVRRIKCDELRPSCRRCTSTGRKCDGYANSTENFHVQVWGSRHLSSPGRPLPLQRASDEGVHYLEFYHRCARPMLSSNFDRDFWSRTTLQMACSEPAVRHALIALGYLHSTEDGSMRHARSSFASQRESSILLRHYNKSVRCLVDRMSESTYRPEIGLVTCLVFVCIEFLRGSYAAAFTHFTNGLKLISAYSHPERHDSPVIMSPGCSETVPITSKLCMSTLMEEELVPLFHRATTSAMMYGVPVEEYIPFEEPDRGYYGCLRINNIRELELSAHKLRNQSILHIRRMSRKPFLPPDIETSEDDMLEQENMLVCQRAWLDSMMRFRESRTFSNTEELIIGTALMHWHCTNIWTACVMETEQMAFDDHLPGFQTILHHSRRLLDSIKHKSEVKAARFSFEISVIPALYFVAQRCRCPTIRREALSLLQRKPPREGLWDAQQHVAVVKRLIEIEEEEVDPTTGWPLARTRLWSSVIDANMDQRGGFWAYFMRVEALHARKGLEKPTLMQEFFRL